MTGTQFDEVLAFPLHHVIGAVAMTTKVCAGSAPVIEGLGWW
jgi:hypothetical protein